MADTEYEAQAACQDIKVDYELLPVVNTLSQALAADAPLVHRDMSQYRQVKPVYPVHNTNIANWTKIRKGDMKEAWRGSEVTVEAEYSFPQSDHAAMETRCSYAEISSGGTVSITSSSQAPFNIKKLINQLFHVPMHNIKVHVPLVGGGFGEKRLYNLNCWLMRLLKRLGEEKSSSSTAGKRIWAPPRFISGWKLESKWDAPEQGSLQLWKLRFCLTAERTRTRR